MFLFYRLGKITRDRIDLFMGRNALVSRLALDFLWATPLTTLLLLAALPPPVLLYLDTISAMVCRLTSWNLDMGTLRNDMVFTVFIVAFLINLNWIKIISSLIFFKYKASSSFGSNLKGSPVISRSWFC